jgi:alkylhydroperoxidase family enzyme
MARLNLPTRETLDTEHMQERWDRTAARGPVLNVMRMFMLQPEIQLNAGQVWRATGLDDRQREIVILRSAFLKQSTYEWHQHVRIARGVGMSDAEINGTTDWQGADVFSEGDRVLLAYVDSMAQGRASDETFAALSKGRSDAHIYGISYLITTYFQLAHMMANFDLETEEAFVGWKV